MSPFLLKSRFLWLNIYTSLDASNIKLGVIIMSHIDAEAYKINNAELLEAYRSGDNAAREKLIINNQKLIKKIALQHTYGGKYDVEDLIQEGNIGLMKAIEKYDNSYDIAFSTYAVYWIKQSIVRSIHDSGRAIRIPAHMQQRLMDLGKVIRELETRKGRKPSIHEISKAIMLPIAEIEKLLLLKREAASLDQPIGGEDEDITLKDSIQADAENPEEIAVEKDTANILKKIIKEKLSERQQEIIYLRYGFRGEIYTFKSIGERYNVSAERIRQDEYKALRQLRKYPQIKTLRLENKLDSITNFYRKTEKVVLWRDEKRRRMVNKNDHVFYKWARKIKAVEADNRLFYSWYSVNEWVSIENAIISLNLALKRLLLECDYHTCDIIKRRIEGSTEAEVKEFCSYMHNISDDGYRYLEAEGIKFMINEMESYGVDIKV